MRIKSKKEVINIIQKVMTGIHYHNFIGITFIKKSYWIIETSCEQINDMDCQFQRSAFKMSKKSISKLLDYFLFHKKYSVDKQYLIKF